MNASKRRPNAKTLPETPVGGSTGQVIGVAVALAILGALAYLAAGVNGTFLFDSEAQIEMNQRILDGPLSSIFTDSRRPVMEFTLFVNANMGEIPGTNRVRYPVFRLTNIVIHVLAGLALFGVIRRSLILPRIPEHWQRRALWIAGAATLIWLVHPLQTQSVAYTIQRAESMMALFYLLTMYCTVRAATSEQRAIIWSLLAIIAAALGMGSKAVMVTVPVAVLLYDRCVITGSFMETLKRRWIIYGGLAASWLLLVAMGIVSSLGDTEAVGDVPPTVGFGVESFTPLTYLLTQSQVILHYIRLAFVPTPLVLDYDWRAVESVASVIPQLLVLGVLGLATLFALWKKPIIGFIGAFFFIVLAPTSSFIPIADAAFEHRMYLPLASIVVLVVVGFTMLVDRMVVAEPGKATMVRKGAAFAFAAVTIAFMVLTTMRTNDYDSALGMWQDVVAKRPDNARARRGLADALLEADRAEEALPHIKRMVELAPDEWYYAYLAAGQLARLKHIDEAEVYYRSAAEKSDGDIRPLVDLGIRLSDRGVGRYDDAFAVFEEALALGDAEETPGRMYKANYNYGIALYRKASYRGGADRTMLYGQALERYEEALRIRPNQVRVHVARGIVFEQMNDRASAIAEYEAALEKAPGYVDAARRLQALRPGR